MMSTMVGKGEESILQFAPFQSAVDEGFWLRLSSLKLNKIGINDSPIPITGFYAPCSNHLTLLAESLPPEASEQPFMPVISRGNRNRCPVPGTLYNINTLERFWSLDKRSILVAEAGRIWKDICWGEVEKDCSVLSRFVVVSFVDLKKWRFHYWFAFPALTLDPPATVVNLKPATQWFSVEEAESVTAACNDWRNMCSTTDVPFFLVSISSNSAATVRHLAEFEACQLDGHKVLFGFYDPCHLPNNPGWPLRNLLCFICRRWRLQKVQFFCYRESLDSADLELTLVGEALIPNSQGLKCPCEMPIAVGWELNSRGMEASRCISLAKTMDPTRLFIEAADLNSRLLRWRHMPSLNLNLLSTKRCLLLGAGTLGCHVARMLMAWGVRKITLVDNGRVSMSNPLRQSLYSLDDCLNGGEYKAVAAVKSLSRIFPAVEAQSVVMTIPMPGHRVPRLEENNVLEDCRHLQDLINSHDAVFLLTDTEESKWLPTVFCAYANKITVTAALGFNSFLVMRNGAGPLSSSCYKKTGARYLIDNCRRQRLGCYFCTNTIAPDDSTSNRTLELLCNVTRPGVAPIASSLAVELLVGILHHPSGISAKSESSLSGPVRSFDFVPHQIIGSLSQFSVGTSGYNASTYCLACSSNVVREYQKRGLAFILEAINYPKHLEDISGQSEWDVIVSYNAEME